MSVGESIKPPWTGEFTLRQLARYPNGRVRALAGSLRARPFEYIPDDRLTGQLVSRLCDFVTPQGEGGYDTSQIRAGTNWRHNAMSQGLGNFYFPERHVVIDEVGPPPLGGPGRPIRDGRLLIGRGPGGTGLRAMGPRGPERI